ncbi:MAG: hypothetical protein ACRDUA_05690 [Micromonosporaceae bacterium]
MTPQVAGFPVVDDPLDLMAREAQDLLRRVDLVIDHLGTPPEHPLVPLLRTLRVRPGEALTMLLAAPPGRLLDSVRQLRELAAAYRGDLVEPLRRASEGLAWRGAGYDAFLVDWTDQLSHLGGEDADSMADRLVATAELVESVAGWFSQMRQAMAGALVDAFTSRDAVVLKGCDLLEGDPATLHRTVITGELQGASRLTAAAAAIGATALSSIEEWYDAGIEYFVAGADGVPAGDWPSKLAYIPEPSGTGAGPSAGYASGVWVRI